MLPRSLTHIWGLTTNGLFDVVEFANAASSLSDFRALGDHHADAPISWFILKMNNCAYD